MLLLLSFSHPMPIHWHQFVKRQVPEYAWEKDRVKPDPAEQQSAANGRSGACAVARLFSAETEIEDEEEAFGEDS